MSSLYYQPDPKWTVLGDEPIGTDYEDDEFMEYDEEDEL